MNKTIFKTAFRRGFTLIELMIVIVILGILMGTILPRISGAQNKAQDVGNMANLNTVSQALEAYFTDYGTYPGTAGQRTCLIGSDAISNAIEGYIKGNTVPKPKKGPSTNLFGTVLNATPCTSGANLGYEYFKTADGYAVGIVLNEAAKNNWGNTPLGASISFTAATTTAQLAAGFSLDAQNPVDAYVTTN